MPPLEMGELTKIPTKKLAGNQRISKTPAASNPLRRNCETRRSMRGSVTQESAVDTAPPSLASTSNPRPRLRRRTSSDVTGHARQTAASSQRGICIVSLSLTPSNTAAIGGVRYRSTLGKNAVVGGVVLMAFHDMLQQWTPG